MLKGRELLSKIVIYDEVCKGCMLCMNNCHFGVIERSEVRGRQGYLLPRISAPEECRGCHMCELVCPDMAIEVRED